MPRKGETVEDVVPVFPVLDNYMVDAVNDYLMTSYNMNRPPAVAAALLTLVVELDRLNQPFPARRHVADFLNCSKFGIDAAISTALARGEITVSMGVEPTTRNEWREGVIKHRYYHPCEELKSVARRARRRAA